MLDPKSSGRARSQSATNTNHFNSCTVISAQDPITTLTVSSSKNKAYHITKYLTEEARVRIKSKRRDLILSRGSSSDDNNLVVRTDEAHPYAGITIQEWGAANSRILYAMLSDGALRQDQISYYLAYTATIFDFASKYEWASVLDYDHLYRERQAQHGFTWGTLNPNSEIQLLRRGTQQLGQEYRQYKYKPRQQINNQELCRQSLAYDHCRFGVDCKYRRDQSRSVPHNVQSVSKNG